MKWLAVNIPQMMTKTTVPHSKIAINELRPAGTMFFSEPETFLNDLIDEAILTQLNGGK
jgi:hypothetical protein